jgi:hypothetical protein
METKELTRQEKAAKIQEILDRSTGSEQFYKHYIPRVIYTEGVHAIAEAAGAHWLIDVIASYQPGLRRKVRSFGGKGVPYQVWRLVVDVENNKGVVTCHEDWNEDRHSPGQYPAIVTQELEYTDFPAPYLCLYCEDGGENMVVLCPREH